MRRLLSIFLATISICLGVPIGGFENVVIAGSQGVANIGQQFQEWSENSKRKVVPHYGSYGRERAVLETEGPISKLDTLYTGSHQLIAKIVGHKPLIDTMQEHERWGNDGEKSRQIGKALIAGFDGVANVVNAALDAPSDAGRYASKQATSILNVIGAKFNGL